MGGSCGACSGRSSIATLESLNRGDGSSPRDPESELQDEAPPCVLTAVPPALFTVGLPHGFELGLPLGIDFRNVCRVLGALNGLEVHAVSETEVVAIARDRKDLIRRIEAAASGRVPLRWPTARPAPRRPR